MSSFRRHALYVKLYEQFKGHSGQFIYLPPYNHYWIFSGSYFKWALTLGNMELKFLNYIYIPLNVVNNKYVPLFVNLSTQMKRKKIYLFLRTEHDVPWDLHLESNIYQK